MQCRRRCGRASTCRSRIRRRGRPPRLGDARSVTPSTACTVVLARRARRAARRCARSRRAAATKRFETRVELEQRAARDSPARRRRADAGRRAQRHGGTRSAGAPSTAVERGLRHRRTHGLARAGSAARRRSPAAGAAATASMPGICAQRAAPGARGGRHRVEQAARVGMARRVEHLAGRPALDDAPGVHHRDAVGEAGDDREVVRDPDQRRARLAHQLLHLGRICAWIVTSSAVVGSSATISSGRCSSAMAMATRWRMPPENWCG